MVTREAVEGQLKKIGFNYTGWGRTEVRELPNIILPDEEIFECANGIYEGGFALLVATNFRVLLVDKKPMKYLTVEDLRFDMINEIDYSHRLLGARISISTGSKNLRFLSYNQDRLRKLIGHVQHCMADSKKKQSDHEEDQKLHLEQINQQLQAYLLAQHQQQQELRDQLSKNNSQPVDFQPVRPDPKLADYLYAQSLLAQHQTAFQQAHPETTSQAQAQLDASVPSPNRTAELYNEGLQEIYGKQQPVAATEPPAQAQQAAPQPSSPLQFTSQAIHHALEVNPLSVAFSKLPLAMRNRKFGRPSFHAHSQSQEFEEEEPSSMPAHTDPATAQY
jgi:hypothetical protein